MWARAGVHAGDRITAIDHLPFSDWGVATGYIEPGRPSILQIERDGQRIDIQLPLLLRVAIASKSALSAARLRFSSAISGCGVGPGRQFRSGFSKTSSRTFVLAARSWCPAYSANGLLSAAGKESLDQNDVGIAITDCSE